MPLPLQLVAENEPHWKRAVRFKWGTRDVSFGVERTHHDWRRLETKYLRFWFRVSRWRSEAEVAQWEQAHSG